MKRIVCFVIMTIALMTPRGVFAATGGVYNDPVTIGGSVSIDNNSPSLLQIPISASMNTDSYNIPDLRLPARLFSGAKQFLMTKSQQEKSIPSENNLFISGSTRLCKSNGTLKSTSGDFYETEAIPELSQLDEGLQSLQFLGHDTLKPNTDGMFNFKREPLKLSELPDCETANTGSTQRVQQIPVAKKFSLTGLVELLKSLFSGKTARGEATVASKQLTPYAGDMNKTSSKIAKTFLPNTMDAANGKDHGEVENELVSGQTVKTRTEHTAAINEYANTVLCSIIPPAQREKVGLTQNDCKKGVQETTSCGTKLPDLSISDSSCKLCRPDDIWNISTSLHRVFPSGIPPTMIKILEKAGASYHVPPKMLLLTLFSEEGLSPALLGSYQYTEENVKKWSFCGETMPFCNPNTNAAMAPFEIRPEVFQTYKTAVSAIFPERKGKENPCNFMDQTFAAAKMMSDNMNTKLPSSTFGTADIKDGNCLGVPLTTLAKTRQNTSCAWSELDLFRGRLMYLRYCPQTGKNHGYIINDEQYAWARLFANNFSCQ